MNNIEKYENNEINIQEYENDKYKSNYILNNNSIKNFQKEIQCNKNKILEIKNLRATNMIIY